METSLETIRTREVAIQCTCTGPRDGDMVVFLHGFPARWSTWRKIMPAFANAGYFAVAPDLRGYGASDRPSDVDAYSMNRIVEDVVEIIDHFGRKKVFLVGHDFGGGVAWGTAMAHPDRVERLGLMNTVHPVGFERRIRNWSQLKKSWYMFFFLIPEIPELWLARDNFAFIRAALLEDGLTPDDVDDLLEGIKPKGALEAAINWYRASFKDGLEKRFKSKKVEIPVLVIWGDKETHLDAELATPPEDWVKNSRVEHVPDAGHWVQHQAPERVSTLLLEHFSSSGGLRPPDTPR